MQPSLFRFGIFAALTLSTSALAGPGSSGGGNSVVCFQTIEQREAVYADLIQAEAAGINGINPFTNPSILSEVTRVESLDLYIHKLPRGRGNQESMSLIEVSESMAANDIVKMLVKRLSAKSNLGDMIDQKMEQIPANKWIGSAGVTRISDSGTPLLFPPNCLVAQIAYRQGTQIYYDQQLYSKMAELSKATLILHEMLYAIAKEFGAETAASVYPVISLLLRSDDEFKNWGAIRLNTELLTLSDHASFSLQARYPLNLGTATFPVAQTITHEGPHTTRIDRRRSRDYWIDMVFGGLQLQVPGNVEMISTQPENLPNYMVSSLFKTGKQDICIHFASYSGCQFYATDLEVYETDLGPALYGSGINKGVTHKSSFATSNHVFVQVNDGCSLETLNGDLNLRCKDSTGKVEIEYYTSFAPKKIRLSEAVFGVGGDEDTFLKSGILAKPIRSGIRKIPAGTEIQFNDQGEMKIID